MTGVAGEATVICVCISRVGTTRWRVGGEAILGVKQMKNDQHHDYQKWRGGWRVALSSVEGGGNRSTVRSQRGWPTRSAVRRVSQGLVATGVQRISAIWI